MVTSSVWLDVFLGEFFGTAVLVLFGNGVVATAILKRSLGNANRSWVMITLGWGMAVFVGVMVAAAFGAPGYINPAVAISDIIGTANSGGYDSDGGQALKALLSIPVSLLGAMFGQVILYFIYFDAFRMEEDHGAVLGSHSTGPVVKNHRNNFMTEALATFVFVGIIVAMLKLGSNDGSNSPYIGALQTLPVALIVLAVGISLGGPTGYAINPARDLGPRIFHHLVFKRDSNWGYAWVPVLGPLVGGIGIGFIELLVTL